MDYLDELEILAGKVEGVDDRSWEDLTYDLGYEYHPDSLRKSFNTGRYSGYNIYKYFTNKMKETFADDEIERLQKAKDELAKERIKLQDNRRLINKELREEARFENLSEVIAREIQKLPDISFDKPTLKPRGNVEASLILSDVHYGLKVDNVLNYYDKNECVKRLNTLLTKTVQYCDLNMVNTLHLFLNGDLISGYIQASSQVDTEEDVGTQIIQIAYILSNFIIDLTKHIPCVKIYGVVGNHSRMNPDKKKNNTKENFERVIFEMIHLITGEKVIRNGLETWLNCKIAGKNVYVSHGDRDSINSVRVNAINVSGVVPDICYLGHVHHLSCVDDNGTEIIVNGSVISTDDYAMSLRTNTKPYQVMQIFDGNDTQIIKINL